MDKKEDIFRNGLKGGPEPKEIHLDKVFSAPLSIFSKILRFIKIIIKPLIILFFLGLLVYSGYWIKECPVCEVCEKCQTCEVCEKQDCSICPKEVEKINLIKYACSNGLIVDNLNNCNPLNYVKITSPYKGSDNDVTFSIDKIEYESTGSYNKITEIDYTIINTGEHEIKPIVLVNLYSDDMENENKGLVHESFELEHIAKDQWISERQKTNIGFSGQNIIVRLVLKDTLTDPDRELVRVSRPLGAEND